MQGRAHPSSRSRDISQQDFRKIFFVFFLCHFTHFAKIAILTYYVFCNTTEIWNTYWETLKDIYIWCRIYISDVINQ